MTDALQALRRVDFDWVRSLDSIWADDNAGADGPNGALIDGIVEELGRRRTGRVLIGQAGIGKTHLMSVLRRKVRAAGGWFVLLDVLGLTDFWRSAALSFLTSLLQSLPDGSRQLDGVVAGIGNHLGVGRRVEEAYANPNLNVGELAKILVEGLVRVEPRALPHLDVARALCLLRSSDVDTMGLAYAWLQGYEADEQRRAALGFRAPPPPPVEIVRALLWVMGLSGPTAIGLDQIDGVVNPTALALRVPDDLGAPQGLAELLAAGLLDLHTVQVRGTTVITCLYDSWQVLVERGLRSAIDRFEQPRSLNGFSEASDVEALIVSRLAPAYQAAGFVPPHPAWPFSKGALAEVAGLTPRAILMRCDAFRRRCLESGRVDVCDSLTGERPAPPPSPVPDGFAAAFAAAKEAADPSGLLTPADDGALGKLLVDAFDLYRRELEPDEAVDVETKADPARKVPPLHGRLTFTYRQHNDRERHHCFRALEHVNAIAFQARLRAALTASGISSRIPDRHLLIVRRAPIPGGAKTRQLFDGFVKAGGVLVDPSDDDLRTFVALRDMREGSGERKDAFDAWLRSEKPLHKTVFFRQAGLTGEPSPEPPAPKPEPPASLAEPPRPPNPPRAEVHVAAAAAIPVGHRMTVGQEPVSLPTRLLPRHTSIIAGSGSGKTVLLRRLVEEAALAGIPAIVIDPNNDLSRLGDPWPAQPETMSAEDAARAQRYFGTVDVVVWTPGLHAGNPLFLPVVPDFASVADDRDERQQAIDMAAETLGPLAGATRQLQRGVLARALRHFAESGGGDLTRFTELLADLPDGVSDISSARKIAATMADQLRASVATNPLLRADGPVLDPKVLFFGPDPAKVRISVINLSGLTSDGAREDFVNRLQMTLFGWIKKNPSATGMLYVVDEAQTFLPSQKQNLSLGSGIKLVAQARKYGLGMIVATQVPRGIHNQVVSNCTTQFFGRQSAPATIGAAQEIIQAGGGRADDIGRLRAGEFYFATEGSGKPDKVRTPICLSHHPQNPPTPEEVVARARRR